MNEQEPNAFETAKLAAIQYRFALARDLINRGGKVDPAELFGFVYVLAQEMATLRRVVFESIANDPAELELVQGDYLVQLAANLARETEVLKAKPKVVIANGHDRA